MKKQSLVKGAFVLTVASFITMILVFSNSIVLSRWLMPLGIEFAAVGKRLAVFFPK